MTKGSRSEMTRAIERSCSESLREIYWKAGSMDVETFFMSHWKEGSPEGMASALGSTRVTTETSSDDEIRSL